jgi:hypothetical protein
VSIGRVFDSKPHQIRNFSVYPNFANSFAA